MADKIYADRPGVIALWKREKGVKQPYKGKTKQTTTTTTQTQWLANLRKKEEAGVQRQEQRTTQYQQEYEQWLAQQKEPQQQQYVVERDNFIIANVPEYLKAMVPMDYFQQFSMESIPEVIDTLNWGLFYGDTGGKWTQGLTEAHYAAKYRLIPPDALLQKGIANKVSAGIMPKEVTPWELEKREMERTRFQYDIQQKQQQRVKTTLDIVTKAYESWKEQVIGEDERDTIIAAAMQQQAAQEYIDPNLSDPQFIQLIWEAMIAKTGKTPPDLESAVTQITFQYDLFTAEEVRIALQSFGWEAKRQQMRLENLESGDYGSESGDYTGYTGGGFTGYGGGK